MDHRNDPAYATPATIDSLRAELAKAAKKIDDDAIERRRLLRQVTELQRRGTELLEEARAARREAAGWKAIVTESARAIGEATDLRGGVIGVMAVAEGGGE